MKIDITGRNFEVDEKLLDYVTHKLSSLEKYLSQHGREAVHAVVVLEDDVSGREDNHCVCDVVLVVPGARLVAREGTINMYAAIDIVEAKLSSQLAKYKDKHTTAPHRGKLLSKWLGRGAGAPVPDDTASPEA